MHPVPDPSEDPQADERRHLLSALSPEPGRGASTAEAESVSRALRRLSLLGTTWQAERIAELEASLQALDDIHRVFLARTGVGCRLHALEQGIRLALRAMAACRPEAADDRGDADAPRPAETPTDATSTSPRPRDVATVAPEDFPLRTRDDVVDDLNRIAAWIRRCEPSSPAPLFVDRAAALLRMDFAAIVRALLPAAGERLNELVGADPGAERR